MGGYGVGGERADDDHYGFQTLLLVGGAVDGEESAVVALGGVSGFAGGETDSRGLVMVAEGFATESGRGAAVAAVEDVGTEHAYVFDDLAARNDLAARAVLPSVVVRHDVPLPLGVYLFCHNLVTTGLRSLWQLTLVPFGGVYGSV